MEKDVLILRPVACGQARYYLDGGIVGRWLGSGCAALSLEGAVEGDDFSAVLAGRRRDGQALLERIPQNRRAGFDLIFAAPKSASLMAALAPAGHSATFGASHGAAVADALDYLERSAVRTRRGSDGRPIATGGLIGAAFVHLSSWAGDPHLHTHVIVANLVLGNDAKWSCLDRLSLSGHARAAGALYQASLRHNVAARGLRMAWQVRPDGLADLRDVPRAAIEACSSSRRRLLADAAAAGLTSPRGRVTAAGRSRRTAQPPEPGWEQKAAEAGLDRRAVANLLELAASPERGTLRNQMDAEDLAAASPAGFPLRNQMDVEDLLIARSSAFTRRDAVAAMAAAAPVEASAEEVEREAQRFINSAVSIDDRRWTTVRARRLDEAMAAVVDDRWRSAGRVAPDLVEAAILGRPGLDGAQIAAVRRLTTVGCGIDVLAPVCLVRQAEVVDAARAAWEAGGHRVAVVTRSEGAEGRWRALTAIGPPPPLPARASVVIVDAADHWPTVALHRLVDDLAARAGKLVLVAGGTIGARREPVSEGFAGLSERVGTIRLSPDVVAPEPVPETLCIGPMADTFCAAPDGTVIVAQTPTDAAARMAADWHAARSRGEAATMVALGPDEAEHLNRLGRARRAAAGELTGPVLAAGACEIQAGDEVRVLRRDRRLGVPAGTTGRVAEVDPRRREATVCWDPCGSLGECNSVVTTAALAGGALTHAYATTPGYLRDGRKGIRGAVLALGQHTGPGSRVYAVVPWPVRRPSMDPVGTLLAALDPAARAIPLPAWEMPADVEGQRNRLAAILVASAPPSMSAALRRIDEDQAWLSGGSQQGSPARLAELVQRRRTLMEAQHQRTAWLDAHRGDLERWAALDATAVWRAQARERAKELTRTLDATAVWRAQTPERATEQTRTLDATAVWRAQTPERATEQTRTQTVADEFRALRELRALREHRSASRRRELGLALDEDLAGISR